MNKLIKLIAIALLMPLALIKRITDILCYPLLKMSGIKNYIAVDIDKDRKTIIVDINGDKKYLPYK